MSVFQEYKKNRNDAKRNDLLQRRVLRDDVAEYLVSSILRGDLVPGDKVVESKLAKELSISQGAVREAIRDLTAQGFLETESYKGTRIRTLTKKQLDDYYDVRTEIESLAVQWSIIKHKSKYLDLDYLKHCVEGMEYCVQKNDPKRMREYDMSFHFAIVQSAHSESLLKAWHSLGNYYWTYIAIYYENLASFLPAQIEKHQLMYEAIASSNIESYKKCVRGHYFNTENLYPVEEEV